MATKTAVKESVDVPKDVASESDQVAAAIQARHDHKIALAEGDTEKAVELTEVAQGGLDATNNPARPADEKKKGDA